MLNLFIRKDTLTGKRSIAPLGCVALFIVTLFIGACVVGWFALLLTSNVTRLTEPAQASAVTALPPQPTVVVVVATNVPTIAPSPPPIAPQPTANVRATMTTMASAKTTPSTPTKSPATQGITWTVQALNVGGATLYDAPKEIKDWIVRDTLEALRFEYERAFEKDYMLALPKYITGLDLANHNRAYQQNASLNLVVPGDFDLIRFDPPYAPVVIQFSADGRYANIQICYRAGEIKVYDLKTRQPKPELSVQMTPITTIQRVEYSPADRRWKIERVLMTIDTTTGAILGKGEIP